MSKSSTHKHSQIKSFNTINHNKSKINGNKIKSDTVLFDEGLLSLTLLLQSFMRRKPIVDSNQIKRAQIQSKQSHSDWVLNSRTYENSTPLILLNH